MTDPPSLIAAVEAASGPDREIDAMVFALFPAPGTTVLGPAGKGWLVVQREQNAVGAGAVRAPEFTASIDAVVALIRREMPGAEEGYGRVGEEFQAYVPAAYPEGGGGIVHTATKPTPPLALLLAFLRAKAQQDETP